MTGLYTYYTGVSTLRLCRWGPSMQLAYCPPLHPKHGLRSTKHGTPAFWAEPQARSAAQGAKNPGITPLNPPPSGRQECCTLTQRGPLSQAVRVPLPAAGSTRVGGSMPLFACKRSQAPKLKYPLYVAAVIAAHGRVAPTLNLSSTPPTRDRRNPSPTKKSWMRRFCRPLRATGCPTAAGGPARCHMATSSCTGGQERYETLCACTVLTTRRSSRPPSHYCVAAYPKDARLGA